ncbi:MAG: hypothetical protein ACD_19C00229G0005 [uncultured bacterium]|nr:MAG: hypothetical protein ACD_19C00229G0005 [uncultured bacterium]
MVLNKDIDLFLHLKRERRRLARLSELKNKRAIESQATKSEGNRLPYNSNVLNLLLPDNHRVRHKPSKKRIVINVPNIFSLISNPKESLSVLMDFVDNERKLSPGNIYFNHGDLEEVELGAEAVLDYVAEEIRKELNSRHYKVRLGGAYPANLTLQKYLREIGIVHKFGIEERGFLQGRRSSLTFEKGSVSAIFSRNSVGQTYNEVVINQFVNYINTCLEHSARELTVEAKYSIGKYIGEVLDNIEQHSGENIWQIVGYLDREHMQPKCEIVIFNFGRTMAQTFYDLPAESYAISKVKPYINLHRKKKSIFPQMEP